MARTSRNNENGRLSPLGDQRRVLGRDNDDPRVDCGGLPTVPVSGRRQHESQLLAPFYDVYDNI